MKTTDIVRSSKLFCVTALCALGLATLVQAAPKKVLVVTVTKGFRHDSIGTAEKVLGQLAQQTGAFTVDYVRTDAEMTEKMTPEALKNYDAVVFANTTGDLPLPDREAFIEWIKSGKGFVGMHAAGDTFHGFKPYLDMLGAEFKTHEAQVSVDAINQDPACPICKHLPATWTVFDEIYQFKNFDRSTVHGLLGLDKHPNNKSPGDYPIAWCKLFGRGRVFYTSLGHREDIWDPTWEQGRKNSKEVAEAYQKHILMGIRWAVRLERFDARPQQPKAR